MLPVVFICFGMLFEPDVAFPPNDNVCNISQHIIIESNKIKVDPFVTLAIIYNESRWKPRVVSERGACGLMQVVPAYTKPRLSCNELKDPMVNISAGLKAVDYWLRRTKRENFNTSREYLQHALNCYSSGNACNHPAYPRRIYKIVDRLKRKYRRMNRDYLLIASQMRHVLKEFF